MENIFRIDLQLFAEGEAAAEGADTAETAANGAGEAAEKMIPQSEVEKIINARFAKLQRDAEKRVEQARKDGMTEGEKLASMSAEERAKAQREQSESEFKAREDALKKREAEVTRRELQAQAVETLTGKGLPAGLAKYLDYADADACSASIAAVEKDFGEMLKAEVDKRLAASAVSLPRGSAAAKQETEDPAVSMAKSGAKAKAEAREKSKNIISKYM